MNQECTSLAADTPASRFRGVMESAGFTDVSAPIDATAAQVVEFAKALAGLADYVEAHR